MTLLDPALAQRAIERALRRGGELAEVYAEDRRGFGLTLDDRRVERPQSGRELGASVRVVSGESSYFGHVDGLAEEDLMRVADSVAQAAGAPASPGVRLEPASGGSRHPVELAPEDVDAARKAELLRSCDETARSAGAEVAQVSVGYVEGRRVVEVYNSDGVPIPLAQVARIEIVDGQTLIAREGSRRRLTVRCDIVGRDQGGFVAEASFGVTLSLGGYTLQSEAATLKVKGGAEK